MAYRLKVSLVNSRPAVTRTIAIADDATLDDLHYAIQDAMDWDGWHLHCFTTDKRACNRIGSSDYDTENEEGEIPLRNLYGFEFYYLYDFGDDWLCKIRWLKDSKEDLDGWFVEKSEGMSPPEDSGGVGSFNYLREVAEDPDDPDYARAREILYGECPDDEEDEEDEEDEDEEDEDE